MTSGTTTLSNTMDQLLLGVIKSLEKRRGVCDVKISKRPHQKHEILNWEQKHSCLLPDDIKSFYLSTDGFLLQWSAKLNDTKVPVGRMEINAITNVSRITGTGGGKDVPSTRDIESDDDEDDDPDIPHFDSRSRIFELDPCDGHGKVCLVYNGTKTGIPATKASIWFLDRALIWHFLSENFTAYYRLMVMHLGLPQWYYLCTDLGLSPQAKQWFNIYAPLRLNSNQGQLPSESSVDIPVNQVDVGRVFKGKVEKKKAPGQTTLVKKKSGTIPAVKASSGASRSATLANQGFLRPVLK
ncbi:tubulin polyglutamylase complex subunit 2-like [Lineus longissimus]|uniref:tubulin polyglutamylase complex subunit 2-like n=1 Tax=Lineus longissimus TaxID=88925 RepID=UPI002B4E77FC